MIAEDNISFELLEELDPYAMNFRLSFSWLFAIVTRSKPARFTASADMILKQYQVSAEKYSERVFARQA